MTNFRYKVQNCLFWTLLRPSRIVPLLTRQDKTRFSRITRLVLSCSFSRNHVLSHTKSPRQRQIVSSSVPIFRLHNPVLPRSVDPVLSPEIFRDLRVFQGSGPKIPPRQAGKGWTYPPQGKTYGEHSAVCFKTNKSPIF